MHRHPALLVVAQDAVCDGVYFRIGKWLVKSGFVERVKAARIAGGSSPIRRSFPASLIRKLLRPPTEMVSLLVGTDRLLATCCAQSKTLRARRAVSDRSVSPALFSASPVTVK